MPMLLAPWRTTSIEALEPPVPAGAGGDSPTDALAMFGVFAEHADRARAGARHGSGVKTSP